MQQKHCDSSNSANRRFPEAVTVAGGGHFTNLAHRYANHPNIDVICIGEGEITFANILRAIESEDDNWENIDGIAFGRDGEMVKNQTRGTDQESRRSPKTGLRHDAHASIR